jgi:hypothetical protein
MDLPTPEGSPGNDESDEEEIGSSAVRNTVSGSASTVVQAGKVDGGLTHHHHAPGSTQIFHSPGRWGWTAIFTCLVLLGGLLLYRALDDGEAVPPNDDTGVPLVAATKPVTQPCMSDWFTPKPPGELVAADLQKPRSWVDVDHLTTGASADTSRVVVTLQGRHANRSVVITDIAVEVLSRKSPPTGTVLHAPCADSNHYRYVDVDLDEPQPRAVGQAVSANAIQEAEKNGWRIDPIAFPYEITSTDAESFLLRASSTSCDCDWIVHFDWSSGDQTGRLTIPTDGGSFRVVSGARATRCTVLVGVTCG